MITPSSKSTSFGSNFFSLAFLCIDPVGFKVICWSDHFWLCGPALLKRFLPQTINWPERETARTAERYERWYRWEWATQRYHNFGVNMSRKMQCREQLMTEIRQTAPGGNRWPSISIGILLPNPVGRAHIMWWGSSSSKALSKMSIWSFVVEARVSSWCNLLERAYEWPGNL